MATIHTELLGVIDHVRQALKDGDGELAVVLLEAGVLAINSTIGVAAPPTKIEPTDDQP